MLRFVSIWSTHKISLQCTKNTAFKQYGFESLCKKYFVKGKNGLPFLISKNCNLIYLITIRCFGLQRPICTYFFIFRIWSDLFLLFCNLFFLFKKIYIHTVFAACQSFKLQILSLENCLVNLIFKVLGLVHRGFL